MLTIVFITRAHDFLQQNLTYISHSSNQSVSHSINQSINQSINLYRAIVVQRRMLQWCNGNWTDKLIDLVWRWNRKLFQDAIWANWPTAMLAPNCAENLCLEMAATKAKQRREWVQAIAFTNIFLSMCLMWKMYNYIILYIK